MSILNEKYKHFVLGENNICETPQTYIVKLSPPSVSIRFTYNENAMFSNYEDFYKKVADVQFFNNDRPNLKEVEQILIDAYNFLCLEEQKLDNDFGV